MEDGKKYLYSERCTFDSQKLKKEESLKGDEVTDDVIYLLAYVNFGTNLCRFYYSYDNVKWKTWGATMTMRYTLDYFVGQRYYLFNYATKKVGGYVDFDWFTTERNFSEEAYGIQGPSGIEQVKQERKLPDDGLYFDLQGRSVSEPTQGLFIRAKDGKKVLFP